MTLWKLKTYTTGRGEKIVKEWCKSVDETVWLAFAFHMDYLCGQTVGKWGRPWAEKLHGKCAGLVEIIFEVGNTQYRPLGYFSDAMEFTILFFATEVGDEFEPRAACEIAKRRRAEIEADRRRASEFIIEENIDDEAPDK